MSIYFEKGALKMSNGALAVLSGAGIAFGLLLIVVAFSIRNNSPGQRVSTVKVVLLLIFWLATVVAFLAGVITLEARLGHSEGMGGLWFFGILAELVSLILMSVAVLDE